MKLDLTLLITIASIIGVIANIKRKRWCYGVWICTNAAWCVYDFTIGAYWQSLLFAIYFALAVWGLVEWRKGK